jgi:Zn-finger nucleic acid-binding protein
MPGSLSEVSVDRIVPTGVTLESGCPVCAEPLQTGEVEGRRALFCPDCRGLLLRHDDFGAIVRERAARRTLSVASEPRPVNPLAAQRRLYCPNCNQLMEVHPYYGPGNVMIDSCSPCGFVWLDQGEITRIERASGGHSELRTSQPLPAVEHVSDSDSFDASGERDQRSPLRFLADLFL